MELSCACGKPAWVAGKCNSCYWRRVNSLVRFGGHREAVLERDREECQVCGQPAQVVHHRKYNPQDPLWQMAMCMSCHARLHRSKALRRFLPKKLQALWDELNPGQPRQLTLPID